MSRLAKLLILILAFGGAAEAQSKPAYAPLPPRPVPTDIKVSSTPPARVMLDEARNARRQAEFIALDSFRKNANKAFALTQELAAAVARPVDARAEKALRKKGSQVQELLTRMIRFLENEPSKKLILNPDRSLPLDESTAKLLRAFESLQPQLASLIQNQGTTLDLELTRSVVQQLVTTRTLAAACAN